MNKLKRSLAIVLTFCMLFAILPTNVFAAGHQHGDQVTTPTEQPPEAVDGAVWVLTGKVECNKIVHSHTESCYYKTCDHKNGHISTCYSSATAYALCEHDDASMHTGSVTLTDVVTIDGTNVTWQKDHPAYSAVYAVYKAAYDEAYASAKFLKEVTAKAAGVAALLNKTFCYTTSAADTPDLCTHGECSDYLGACYTKICILEEHAHDESCFQYTWTLKSDMNKNGVADDVDQYYVVKYVDGENVLYEEAILVGMPMPTIAAPSKAADAQYTYTFVGWDVPVADTVTEDITYTAVYTNAVNKYTVTWLNDDGTVLEVDEEVEYGTMPNYNSALPQKAGDNDFVYEFAGWTPYVEPVTGNVTYTARYTSTSVYEVKFFIDGELQKTEYVVEGEKVAPYVPVRAQYELSAWMEDYTEFSFDQPVWYDIELHASWTMVETIVTVKGQHASYTTNANTYAPGDNVVVVITPDDGYAISQVAVNGQVVTPVYANGVATVEFATDLTTEKYEVVVTANKVYLNLNAAEMNLFGDISAEAIFNAVYAESFPTLKFSDVTVEYLAYSIELFGKTYEWWVAPGTDVSLAAFLDQYGLGSLASYIPVDAQPHAFGAQSTERVRVSYAGTQQYCAVSAETTVAVIDLRTPTTINLNQGVTVTYGATADEILALVFGNVAAENGVVTNDVKNVTIQMSSLNAGTRKAIVSFAGTQEYAASVAEVEVTIQKAVGQLTVDSYTGKYGTDVNVSELFNSNAYYVQVIAGVALGNNASADMNTVIYVNMPELVDLNSIENETVRAIAEKIVNAINDKMSGTMTIAELKAALEDALPYIEQIENAGYETTLNANTINMLINVLNEISELDGVGDVRIQLSVNQDIVLKDAGAYLIAGVTSDSNYTTAVNAGYIAITPDGYRAELDWNIHDQNGIITLEALNKGYDMGASVVSVAEGNIKDANAHVYTIFFGVNKAGEMVFTQDKAELSMGAYTQVAFLLDAGNTMYYAEPIVRAFVLAADIVNVQFVDAQGNVNNERVFEYGQNAAMNAVAFDRVTGEVETDGAMTYLYMGMQANGEFYQSNHAPTRPGAYTVIALFMGTDELNVGAAVGTLVINQIDVDFYTEDYTVVFDGEEHMIAIMDNTGMQHILVIVDENGVMNLIIPESLMNTAAPAPVDALSDILDTIEGILAGNVNDIPEELVEYYNTLKATVEDTIAQLKAEYNVQDVVMNAPLPSERGVYRVAVIGFKDMEHKIAVSKATLTIACGHVYDNDCDTDCNECDEVRRVDEHVYDNACDESCNVCDATREVVKHAETYINRYESTCVRQGYEKVCCKACDEVISETTLPLSEEHAFYNGACLLCGVSEKCEHDYVTVREQAPNCIEAGYRWTECSKCGNEKNYEFGEATGVHGDTYIDRYESTCIKKGYEKTRCKVCDTVLTEKELPLSNEHAFYNSACLLCGTLDHCVHNYTTVKEQAPSCGEKGYRWTQCTRCGEEYNYEFGEPTGEHTYDNACDAECNVCGTQRDVDDHQYADETIQPPTCGESGIAHHTCTECGYSFDSTLEATGEHVFDNACDATCDVCGEIRDVAPHPYTGTITKAPECGANGEMTYVCPECGDSYTDIVPATGNHEFDNECDAECNRCDYVRNVQGHTYDNACDEYCNICGETREVIGHMYDNACDVECNFCGFCREVGAHRYEESVTKAPTCAEDGTRRYTCSVCGFFYEVSIDATEDHAYDNNCDVECNVCGWWRNVDEHNYVDEVIQQPTCNEFGIVRYTCIECGDSYDSYLNITEEHKFESSLIQAPTCGNYGVINHSCTVCGYSYEEYVDAAGEHTYDNACDVECNVCGLWRTTAEHTYVEEVTQQPTCSDFGTMCYTCSECGYYYEFTIDFTNEHIYDNDCDRECSVCGFLREANEHVFDNDCDMKCNVCGAEREFGGHSYNIEVTKYPTCNEAGEQKYTCPVCGDSYTEVLNATGEHVYDDEYDAKCNACGAMRDVPERPVEECTHEYDNACDNTCNKCGAERVVDEHVYDNSCDDSCNICGAVRDAFDHIYDNDCDAYCNECQASRPVAGHVYDNDCDADCNTCGAKRDVLGHIYTNSCDASCNICGTTRDASHTYDDEYDATCNKCGETREVEQKPTEPTQPTEPTNPTEPTQPTEPENPNTKDNMLWLWIVLAAALVTGVAVVIFIRKKKSVE